MNGGVQKLVPKPNASKSNALKSNAAPRTSGAMAPELAPELALAGGVLSKAAAMLHDRFGALDDLPDDVANTVANYCYRWVLLTSESALPRFVVGSPEREESGRDELAWKLDGFPDELAAVREIRRSRGERAFSRACELFVDRHTYGIVDADHKSGFRRKIERIFKRTGQIRELYRLMKADAGS